MKLLKSIVILVTALFFCVTVFPQVATVLVKTQRANVREKPLTESKVVGTVTKGQKLPVFANEGSWYYVTTSKIKGWIHYSAIEVISRNVKKDTLPNLNEYATDIDYSKIYNDEWIAITSSDDTTFYYNPARMKKIDGKYFVWQKRTYNPPSKDTAETLGYSEVNCKNLASRTTRLISYSSTGKIIGDIEGNEPIKLLIPETIGETMFKEICSALLQQPSIDNSDNTKNSDVLDEILSKGNGKSDFVQCPNNLSDSEDRGIDIAIAKTNTANLREQPDSKNILAQISKGTRLALINRQPNGDWFNVIYIKTGQEGWIHKTTVDRYCTQKQSTSIFQTRGTTSNAIPKITIKNSTNRLLTLRIGETKYEIQAFQQTEFTIQPGAYRVYASVPGAYPNIETTDFSRGVIYSIEYYIETKIN